MSSKNDAQRDVNSMLAQATETPLQQKPDDVLVALFQSGEVQPFRVLVERYQERVRNIIYSIFRDRDIVDDLAQEVFIKVYEALPRFRFESSFYTWLYRITVNRSRDELRKKKVRKFFSFDFLDESDDKELNAKIAVEPHNNEAQELVAKGLQTLPDIYRLPIILKDIEGFSYEEIAQTLECEIGTVKSRLSRGREMLRKALHPLLKES